MSTFINSELVWVKLGGVQWPAVVKDKADCEEFLEALKREPLVVVEFFDKKLHDVYNENHVCRYNCEEKEDIIQKSLQFTRNKPDIADDFKKDVITAEKLSDGDVHILGKPRFMIQNRPKHDDLFGGAKKSPTKSASKVKAIKLSDESKKKSKYSDLFPESQTKSKKSTPKMKKIVKSSSESPRLSITHPRFVVENDHEVRILAPDSPLPCASTSKSDQYTCHQCPFSTSRLNVLVMHNKTHIVAATAGAKQTPGKRKNSDSRAGTPTKKPRKKADLDGSVSKAKPSPMKTDKTATPKKSSQFSPDKGESKKMKKYKSASATPEKSKTPVKVSPLKPEGSSKPFLIDDWDEDDDEEVAEREKIQTEIDRFINGRRSVEGNKGSLFGIDNDDDSDDWSDTNDKSEKEQLPENADSSSNDATRASEKQSNGRIEEASLKDQESSVDAVPDQVMSSPVRAAESEEAVVIKQQRELQARNDALLQAAVEDVLADTVPIAVPTLPSSHKTSPISVSTISPHKSTPVSVPALTSPLKTSPAQQSVASRLAKFDFVETAEDIVPMMPRPRPVRVCPAEPTDGVTSSARAPAPSDLTGSPTTLPPNLQILSVPGGDGNPDTYALVSVDDKGTVQTVNPGDSLQGLSADTLLAYEVLQEDGTTRTAYLSPSALSNSADIKHLLGGDGCRVDSSIPLPDSSGAKY